LAFCNAPSSQKVTKLAAVARLPLEETKQFEDDHDNDNYPDYVEDVSVHDGD
jgi:hypothetical protein